MLLIKKSVWSLKEKQHNFGFPTFKLLLKSFKTHPLNMFLDDFSI